MSAEEERAGALAEAILELEAERQAEGDEHLELTDDVLPGVGDQELTLRQALAIGGAFTFVIVALLVAVDGLASSAFATLAPDMARTIGLSASATVGSARCRVRSWPWARSPWAGWPIGAGEAPSWPGPASCSRRWSWFRDWRPPA